jgi:hypothetical protein
MANATIAELPSENRQLRAFGVFSGAALLGNPVVNLHDFNNPATGADGNRMVTETEQW